MMNLAQFTFVGLVAFATATVAGERPHVAVFPTEIVRGADSGGAPERIAAEEKRLADVTRILREKVAASNVADLADTSAFDASAGKFNLQACGHCADEFASKAGAQYAVTAEVHKVSELVLSIHVYVNRVADHQLVAAANVDIRGNTDESWRRGIVYLFDNVLLKKLKAVIK